MAALPTSRCRAFYSGLTLALCSACATYVDEPVVPGSVALGTAGAAGDGAMSGGAGTDSGGSSSGTTNQAGASAGMMAASGASSAGSGGTLGGSGGAAGASGSAGSSMGGKAGAGGMAGSGGAAGSGGMGGSGGGGNCATRPIPVKSGWNVTAVSSNNGDPTTNAHDGNLTNRWSTGADQTGDEWLQIDFGKDTGLTKLTLMLGNSIDDYPRMYQTRISNTAMNTALTPQLSGSGQKSTDTVMTFPKGTHGRYVLISQTGSVTGLWWSIAEIQAECAD